MTDKFKKFLEEHDCLEPYTNNIKDLNNRSYFDKFKWSDTPEGYEYWCELDVLWHETLNQKEPKTEKEKFVFINIVYKMEMILILDF